MIKLNKQKYEILIGYEDKLRSSIQNATVWGYTKEELKELQELYHTSGGSKYHNIIGCSSCVFTIFKSLLDGITLYKEVERKKKTKATKKLEA